MKSNKLYSIILMTFFGMTGSILIGVIFFKQSIFFPSRPTFQFIGYGLYGALLFSLLEYRSVRDQIYGTVMIFFVNLIIFTGKSISFAYIIRDFFLLGGLFLSIILYYQFLKNYSQSRFYLRSLILVLFYGILNVLFSSIVFIVNSKTGFPPFSHIYFHAKFGMLIGFGIAVGIDFYLQNKESILKLIGSKVA